jgi:bifunctional non-homologous end joining protein LigD
MIDSVFAATHNNNLPRIEPLKLIRIVRPFDHADWLFELKHDGFRAIAYISKGECTLVSRRAHVYKSFAPLRTAIAEQLRVHDAVLDGEIVCLDQDGRSLFNELLFRRREPVLYAFDLLWLNGRDLRQLPLLERKKKLRQIIGKWPDGHLLYAEHIEQRGTEFFRLIRERDLEGVVAKHRAEPYSPGARWIKIKNPDYTQTVGRDELFERRNGTGKLRKRATECL